MNDIARDIILFFIVVFPFPIFISKQSEFKHKSAAGRNVAVLIEIHYIAVSLHIIRKLKVKMNLFIRRKTERASRN